LTRLLIAGAACIGLIALLTLVVSRLIQSRRRGLSVRMQIFLALAGIVGAFAFGLGLLVLDRIEARAERLARAAAQEEAYAVAAILQSEMKRADVPFPLLASQLKAGSQTSAEFPVPHMEGMGLELLTVDRQVIFPAIASSRAKEAGAVFVDALVYRAGSPAGIVRVVKPTIVVQALLADFAPTVLVISLVLGAAAAAAAAWIGRTIATPIEALSVYSQRVSEGERPALPEAVVGREVARLARSIETMRERLEGRPFVETFAADLSHELKNPVAAIRASAEVLEEGALDEPEQARRFVHRIHEAAVRIERLFSELLSLAQVETRGPEHLEKVRLADLVAELHQTREDDTDRMVLDIHSQAFVSGDRGWLTRAISNLLDNSLVHSPPGSTVRVGVTENEGEVVLFVENDGQLDPHVRQNVFRRFVTTRREQGGTGLGLSIVRAIAEAHGGHAELVESGPPRVRIQMRLPETARRGIGAS
jgi:signal transduction histidine kinase